MDLNSTEIIEALKICNWDVIDKFVANGGDINSSLVSTGPETGYTALHFAVKNNKDIVKLIKYKVNVNSVAQDGAQPLAIACLLGNLKFANILLENGADIDCELTKEVVEKYSGKWSDKFEVMTLLSYAVINNDDELCTFLVGFDPDFGIKDRNNKTLLMYAVENYNNNIVWSLITYIEDSEVINARDDDDFHAFHYMIPKKSGEMEELRNPEHQRQIFYALNMADADINAMVDDNPETLIINMAARRSYTCILSQLLEIEVSCSGSRALFYAFFGSKSEDYEAMDERRQECVKLILEDYTFRRTFGLFVPKEEIKLMDQLVPKNKNIKKIVSDYEEVISKNLVVRVNEEMTIKDLVDKVFDDRALKRLVKDKKFIEDFKKFSRETQFEDHKMLKLVKVLVYFRIDDAWERRKLMEKVEKIPQLLESILLPYEIILEVIEYLDNEDLEKFVEAFYRDPIN